MLNVPCPYLPADTFGSPFILTARDPRFDKKIKKKRKCWKMEY